MIHSAYRALDFSIQRSDGKNIGSSIEQVIDLIGVETRAQGLCFSLQHCEDKNKSVHLVSRNRNIASLVKRVLVKRNINYKYHIFITIDHSCKKKVSLYKFACIIKQDY